MKLHLCVLSILLIIGTKGHGGEIPPIVQLELNTIKALVDKSFAFDEKPSSEGYWQAMTKLGFLVKEGDGGWLTSLTPLERRIVELAVDHAQHPEYARTLVGWYGCYEAGVSAELRGITDKKVFEAVLGSFARTKTENVERLHDEHATETYRRAWEAWLLAPASREKDVIILTAFVALARTASDDSIPVIMEVAKQGTKEKHSKVVNREMVAVLYFLSSLKSEASILAMLSVFDLAKKHQIAPSNWMSVEKFRAAADKDAFLDDVFVLSISGYYPDASPGENPLQHCEGKLFLPAIESALKRKDLSPAARALLMRTADTIRRHCLE